MKLSSSLFTVAAFLTFLPVNFSARADDGILVKDGQKVAFMGDSITAQGWEVPGGYVKLVTEGLETLGVKIVPIPAGVGGNTSLNMLNRLDRDVLSKKPDWLTLSCGVNDVWHGADGVALEPYEKNITSIVDQAQAAGIKVVILTATVIGEDLPNEANTKLIPYNTFLRKLAKERDLPIADENQAFQDAIKTTPPLPGTKLLTHDDGVHPDSEGHLVMARTLLTAFGATPSQIAKVEQIWLDAPASANVGSTLAFHVGEPITIRQYRALKVAADQQKLSVDIFCVKIFYEAMLDAAKTHASDPTPPTESAVEGEMQKGFLAKVAEITK